MHIVTYSSLYNSIGEAMTNIHGLAVVGFFFQVCIYARNIESY